MLLVRLLALVLLFAAPGGRATVVSVEVEEDGKAHVEQASTLVRHAAATQPPTPRPTPQRARPHPRLRTASCLRLVRPRRHGRRTGHARRLVLYGDDDEDDDDAR